MEAVEPFVALAVRNLVENARSRGRAAPAIGEYARAIAYASRSSTHGPGVDEASRVRMFDRYWRASAHGEGRGLGLALVQSRRRASRAPPWPSLARQAKGCACR